MKKLFNFSFIAILVISLSGCLTSEYKEYTIELDSKGAGKMTIRYIGILSARQKDDTESPKVKDYKELIESYLDGSKIQEDFPKAKIISKKLFEENGKLNGEVVFSFQTLADIKVYQYDKKSPYMYNLGLFSDEKVVECNGRQGPDYLPTIFWDKKTKKMTLKTKLSELSEANVSLLDLYQKDKK